MYSENERFISMYREQVKHTLALVKDLPRPTFQEIPLDTDSMFMGNQENKRTIRTTTRHLIVVEHHWFEELARVGEGDVMPLPQDTAVVAGIVGGEPILNPRKKPA
ncbi:MAG: hypothetical protein HC880_14525 [Bacteroidia bacterium]|nr:hypothetical protein [Bacteroidia bacterium]